MAYQDREYLRQARKMFAMNQEQVDGTTRLIEETNDINERMDLLEELSGWMKYRDFWKKEYDKAAKKLGL